MFWKYSLFELNILLRQPKQWFLGLLIISFFPLYFFYYVETEPDTLESERRKEGEIIKMVINQLPDDLQETPEGKQIYENITEQSSHIFMQIFYLARDMDREDFLKIGYRLNELRLDMHELGNPHVPEYAIISKEDISNEIAFLQYLEENDLSIPNNPFETSQFIMTALQLLSGIWLYLVLLLYGSDMLVYESKHRSIMNGMPIPFVKKMVSKISIYYLYISACLTGGLIAGIYFSNKEAGWGDFSYPMTVYTRDGYEVIPRSKYLLYVLLAMLVIILMVLCLSILMNIFFKNMYANVLFGLGLFALADLLQAAGLNVGLLYPIKFVDFAPVLSGETAIQIDQSSIDYRYMMIWLIISVLALMVILFGQNRLRYVQMRRKRASIMGGEDHA